MVSLYINTQTHKVINQNTTTLKMGNSLRCCLACVLPCGALDLIRIVHLNGNVEEITGPITAGEILKANPNHVLSKPTSQGVVRRIVILSPESELKRGSIYFLIPSSSVPAERRKSTRTQSDIKTTTTKISFSVSDKKHRRDRKGRVVVWQPHLSSISED